MKVRLREYIERLIGEMDRRYEQRFAAYERALAKADEVLREYKANANEWGATLKEANHRAATRVELEKVNADVQELRRSKASFVGGIAVGSALVSGVVSLLIWALSQAWQQ